MEELQLSDRDKYENELQDTFAELPEDDGTYQKNSTRSEMQAAENTQDPVRADSTDHDGASRGEGTKAAAETKETDSLTAEDKEGGSAADGGGSGVQESDGLSMYVSVNGAQIRLAGKTSYVFVDVFEHIDFDLSKPQGSGIVTRLNGRDAQYMEEIHSGDMIEIYWKKS